MSGRIEDLTGITIVAESGSKYKLTKQAGGGAQGVVYEETSGKYMIKFYYPSDSKAIDADVLERIRFIKNIQMPQNFVSVVDVIVSPYVGYVMDKVVDHKPLNSYLIPDKNMPFSEWYNQGLGLYERIFVGYVIAKAFGELERSNLSYCDISGNNILIKTVKTTSIVMLLIATSIGLSWVMSFENIPQTVSNGLLSLSSNPFIILLMINLILLFVGIFMDMTPAVLIFTPIFLPIVTTQLGMDPIHFGIIMILNLNIGLCTPPVGSVLFIGCSVANMKIQDVVKPLIPFFIAMIAILIIITFFPSITMFVPRLFGF